MHRALFRYVGVVVLAGALLPAMALPVAAASPGPERQSVIVTFNDPRADSTALTARLSRQHGFQPTFIYTQALRGFAGSLPSAAVEALRRNPAIASVEADAMVRLAESPQTITDSGLWGLDRIDERQNPRDALYTYDATGTGVNAYVLDTGVLSTHVDLEGRVVDGYDSIDGSLPADDCHGHGTHVAGTVGGATYGVAKDVTLVAVRVLDCNGQGTWSGIIAGIDWVTGHRRTTGKPAVANMSISGPANTSVDNAVRNSISSGVSYAIAAGNGNFVGVAQDACKVSPARTTEAMTIAATDSSDRKASWSNYGKCVDWFAPGVGVKSAWNTGNTATNSISGTSMATPHTAGVAALYLQGNPTATPAQVRDAIYGSLTRGVVTSSKTVNNHLLCSRFSACSN